MKLPRTLTVDDDPPVGSIVIDYGNDAWQLRSRNKWHMASVWSQDTHPLQLLIEHYGPLTLVWGPPTTKDK